MKLTDVRSTELRHAEWQEIDLEKAIWEIPAEKMKQNKPHIIPLSKQAISILKEIYPYTSNYRLVFTGRNNPDKPISDGTEPLIAWGIEIKLQVMDSSIP